MKIVDEDQILKEVKELELKHENYIGECKEGIPWGVGRKISKNLKYFYDGYFIND